MIETAVRNPNPSLPPFLNPLMDIYDWLSGAGLWLAVIGIVLAAILLIFARLAGSRIGTVVGALVGIIAAVILILNAGTFLNMFT